MYPMLTPSDVQIAVKRFNANQQNLNRILKVLENVINSVNEIQAENRQILDLITSQKIESEDELLKIRVERIIAKRNSKIKYI